MLYLIEEKENSYKLLEQIDTDLPNMIKYNHIFIFYLTGICYYCYSEYKSFKFEFLFYVIYRNEYSEY